MFSMLESTLTLVWQGGGRGQGGGRTPLLWHLFLSGVFSPDYQPGGSLSTSWTSKHTFGLRFRFFKWILHPNQNTASMIRVFGICFSDAVRSCWPIWPIKIMISFSFPPKKIKINHDKVIIWPNTTISHIDMAHIWQFIIVLPVYIPLTVCGDRS